MALGGGASDRPARSAPAAKCCRAAKTAALTKRPARSLASIRPRATASRSGTSARRPRIGGTGASTWAFIFRYTDPWSGPANQVGVRQAYGQELLLPEPRDDFAIACLRQG